jgi:transcriptional regulator with XRE-family HTH domain
LAERVGVSANYIGVLERGTKLPTLDTLALLAKALSISTADLIDDGRIKDDWLDELSAIGASVPNAHRSLALAILRVMATHR